MEDPTMANNQSKLGMSFESAIQATNKIYQIKGLANIQKIPTPTKNIKGRIVYAEQSTVDFIGKYRYGGAIAFEAKETSTETSFPLTKRYKGKDVETVLIHQREFLRDWEKMNGVAFLLINFSNRGGINGECYRVPVDFIEQYYLEMHKGGRKSIPVSDFKPEWIVSVTDYLGIL